MRLCTCQHWTLLSYTTQLTLAGEAGEGGGGVASQRRLREGRNLLLDRAHVLLQ